MRIISGKLGGRRLLSSPGRDTRPTSDRVREALFNILGARVGAGTVLDLFAGTGALGIEAVSRGAAGAVCIDESRTALETIQKNIRSLALEKVVRTIKWDIARNLGCIRSPEPVYELVFMDPPYDRGLVSTALDNLHHSRSVKPGATLVVEHSGREPLPADRPFLALTDQRKYGKTLVSFLTYMV